MDAGVWAPVDGTDAERSSSCPPVRRPATWPPGGALPSVAADGSDAWFVGPLDAAEVARRAELIAALPPAADWLPAVTTGAGDEAACPCATTEPHAMRKSA